MILVDVNLLLYAEDEFSPHHQPAKDWWVAQLSGEDPVCLCWPVLTGFIRISTNRRLFSNAISLSDAISRVESWFAQPCVRLIYPTPTHWRTLRTLLEQAQANANLVTDAHLAALAIEHGCELCSTDADFSRFPRLKWRNPLRRVGK